MATSTAASMAAARGNLSALNPWGGIQARPTLMMEKLRAQITTSSRRPASALRAAVAAIGWGVIGADMRADKIRARAAGRKPA